MLLLDHARDLSTGAEEEETDAGDSEACNLCDLAVGVVFGVGEPEELTVAGTHAGHGGAEDEP